MALILYIETSEQICSVAISDENKIIGIKESTSDRAHASALTVLINELLTENGFTINQLSAVTVSMGPGSYTGLRIGVSAAKGICYALNIPLIAINTLLALTYGMLAIEKFDNNFLFCPMVDAKRMEVYKAIYNINLEIIEPTIAEIIDNESFNKLLLHNKVLFFGSGALKCKQVINNNNAFFNLNIKPRAEYLLLPALNKFKNKQFEDIAYFEPFYLKDFVVSISKIN